MTQGLQLSHVISNRLSSVTRLVSRRSLVDSPLQVGLCRAPNLRNRLKSLTRPVIIKCLTSLRLRNDRSRQTPSKHPSPIIGNLSSFPPLIIVSTTLRILPVAPCIVLIGPEPISPRNRLLVPVISTPVARTVPPRLTTSWPIPFSLARTFVSLSVSVPLFKRTRGTALSFRLVNDSRL